MCSKGYGSAVCVCVCVLLLQLTLQCRNDTTYSAGNENQLISKIISENAPLLRSTRYAHSSQSAIYCGKHTYVHCPSTLLS